MKKKKVVSTVNIPSEIIGKIEVLETEYPGFKDCFDKYFSKFKKNTIEIIDVLLPNEEGHKMVQISFLESLNKKDKEKLKKELWLLLSDKKWSIPPFFNKP